MPFPPAPSWLLHGPGLEFLAADPNRLSRREMFQFIQNLLINMDKILNGILQHGQVFIFSADIDVLQRI